MLSRREYLVFFSMATLLVIRGKWSDRKEICERTLLKGKDLDSAIGNCLDSKIVEEKEGRYRPRMAEDMPDTEDGRAAKGLLGLASDLFFVARRARNEKEEQQRHP